MIFGLIFLRLSLLMLIMGVHLVSSHSWLNYVEVEAKKAVGYVRAYIKNDPKNDEHNSYVMEFPSDPICGPFQQQATNSAAAPRLKASPGDRVIAWHYENGHVSDPKTIGLSGRTYWFGTSKPSARTTIGDVLGWKDNGDELGGPGQYLDASLYDDGKCAEPNPTTVSARRGVGPGGQNRPCRDGGFVVPSGLKAGSVYTVYWVWDYTGHFPDKPNHFEYYSSCLDIDIVAGSGGSQVGSSPVAVSSSAPSKPTNVYNAPSRALAAKT